MQSPKQLLDLVVAQIQSIPELAVVDVRGYDVQSQLFHNVSEALDNLVDPGVLVIWTGAVSARLGDQHGWKHSMEIVVRAVDDASGFELLRQIVDGVPAGNGCWKFHESAPSDDYDPPQELDIRFATDRDGNDFLRLAYAIVEK